MADRTALKGVGRDYIREFLVAQKIVEHARQIRGWPRWARLGHRLLVSWRCPACRAFARKEHEEWGLKP